MKPSDPLSLRTVLGCYATGVAILTTRTASGKHVAVTVNSFASVSLAPPLILFSLGISANVLEHFQVAASFNVNILSHQQEALSNGFARPSSAPWQTARYTVAGNGCALFADCLAQLECVRVVEMDGGDHRIFLGSVTRVHLHEPSDPLLFFRGRYGTYTQDRPGSMPPEESTLRDLAGQGWA